MKLFSRGFFRRKKSVGIPSQKTGACEKMKGLIKVKVSEEFAYGMYRALGVEKTLAKCLSKHTYEIKKGKRGSNNTNKKKETQKT